MPAQHAHHAALVQEDRAPANRVVKRRLQLRRKVHHRHLPRHGHNRYRLEVEIVAAQIGQAGDGRAERRTLLLAAHQLGAHAARDDARDLDRDGRMTHRDGIEQRRRHPRQLRVTDRMQRRAPARVGDHVELAPRCRPGRTRCATSIPLLFSVIARSRPLITMKKLSRRIVLAIDHLARIHLLPVERRVDVQDQRRQQAQQPLAQRQQHNRPAFHDALQRMRRQETPRTHPSWPQYRRSSLCPTSSRGSPQCHPGLRKRWNACRPWCAARFAAAHCGRAPAAAEAEKSRRCRRTLSSAFARRSQSQSLPVCGLREMPLAPPPVPSSALPTFVESVGRRRMPPIAPYDEDDEEPSRTGGRCSEEVADSPTHSRDLLHSDEVEGALRCASAFAELLLPPALRPGRPGLPFGALRSSSSSSLASAGSSNVQEAIDDVEESGAALACFHQRAAGGEELDLDLVLKIGRMESGLAVAGHGAICTRDARLFLCHGCVEHAERAEGRLEHGALQQRVLRTDVRACLLPEREEPERGLVPLCESSIGCGSGPWNGSSLETERGFARGVGWAEWMSKPPPYQPSELRLAMLSRSPGPTVVRARGVLRAGSGWPTGSLGRRDTRRRSLPVLLLGAGVRACWFCNPDLGHASVISRAAFAWHGRAARAVRPRSTPERMTARVVSTVARATVPAPWWWKASAPRPRWPCALLMALRIEPGV
ncbi:hypothetical protein L1887_59477 [Cichorium endivia]|nr:hypothetical protein L1887_59477 [Cichorium endivia]